jgi:hypothetical protein
MAVVAGDDQDLYLSFVCRADRQRQNECRYEACQESASRHRMLLKKS